jgi:hypothetical protein
MRNNKIDKIYLKNTFRSISSLSGISRPEKPAGQKARKFVSLLYLANMRNNNFLSDDFYFGFSVKIKRDNGKIIPSIRILNHNYYLGAVNGLQREKIYKKRGQIIRHIFKVLGFSTEKNLTTLDYLLEKTYDKDALLPVQFDANFEKNKNALKVYFWCGIKYSTREHKYAILKEILEKEEMADDISFLCNRNIELFSFDFGEKRKSAKIYVRYRMNSREFYADLKKFNFDKETIADTNEFFFTHKEYLQPDVTICYNVAGRALSMKKIELFLNKKLERKTRIAKKVAANFTRKFSEKFIVSLGMEDFFGKSYAYAVGENFIAVYFQKIKSEKNKPG